MAETTREMCEECCGAGELCGTCGETPDNCDHEDFDERSVECSPCNGNGYVDEDEDEDDR